MCSSTRSFWSFWWLSLRCSLYWLMRSLLLQDWCYFICLACTTAKIFRTDTPDFAEDFDSLICLACTMANAPIFTTTRSWFFTIMMLLKDPKEWCSREDNIKSGSDTIKGEGDTLLKRVRWKHSNIVNGNNVKYLKVNNLKINNLNLRIIIRR